MSKRRILSIDGGGIKGLYPASFLEGLMEMNAAWDRPLWSYFDLIAGTSTGAILAAGIAADVPIKKMVEFYQTYGKKISTCPVDLRKGKQRDRIGEKLGGRIICE